MGYAGVNEKGTVTLNYLYIVEVKAGCIVAQRFGTVISHLYGDYRRRVRGYVEYVNAEAGCEVYY